MSKADWSALEAIHSQSAPSANAVACHSFETLIEMADERAAIMEYDGRLSRKDAETYAFRKIK